MRTGGAAAGNSGTPSELVAGRGRAVAMGLAAVGRAIVCGRPSPWQVQAMTIGAVTEMRSGRSRCR